MPCDQRVGVVGMGMRRVQGVQGVQGMVQVQGVEGVLRQGMGMVQGVTEVDNFSKAFSKLFSTEGYLGTLYDKIKRYYLGRGGWCGMGWVGW